MSRVEINAGGRQIIVDHDGAELPQLAETALDLWTRSEAPAPSVGPASAGFQMDRRWTPAHEPQSTPGRRFGEVTT